MLYVWPHCSKWSTHVKGNEFLPVYLFIIIWSPQNFYRTTLSVLCQVRKLLAPSSQSELQRNQRIQRGHGYSFNFQIVFRSDDELWTMCAIPQHPYNSLMLLLNSLVTLGRKWHSWSSKLQMQVIKFVFIYWNVYSFKAEGQEVEKEVHRVKNEKEHWKIASEYQLKKCLSLMSALETQKKIYPNVNKSIKLWLILYLVCFATFFSNSII